MSDWRRSVRAAATTAVGDLTDDDLLDALFWLVRETSQAVEPTGLALSMAGTPLTAEHVELARAIWFHTHLLGILELAQEYYRRHPNLVVEAADWRNNARSALEQEP